MQELKNVATKQNLNVTEPGRIMLSGSIRQSDGAFVLTVNADPGQTVKVHGAEDLTTWVEVGEITGSGEVTIPTPYGVQYFRAQASGINLSLPGYSASPSWLGSRPV